MTNFKEAFLCYQEGDSPILYELGIDFSHIMDRIKIFYFLDDKKIENNFENNSEIMQDTNINIDSEKIDISKSTDLTGPLIFLIILSFSLLLNGKLLFGAIYLLSIILSFLVHFLLQIFDFYFSFFVVCSILGYSLLPIILFTFISSFRFNENFKLIIGSLLAFWSSIVAGKRFFGKLHPMNYTLWVFYMAFVILALY